MEKHHPFILLTLIPHEGQGEMALSFAGMLARSRHGRLEVLYNKPPQFAGSSGKQEKTDHIPAFKTFLQAIEKRVTSHDEPVDLLVVDWTTDWSKLQAILNLMVRLNLPGVIVNWAPEQKVRRILFTSSGGLHTVPQVWIVRELVKELKVATRILRIVQPADESAVSERAYEEEMMQNFFQLRMLGFDIPVEAKRAEDVVGGIRQAVEPDDLVIFGGPNYGRTINYFKGSIPEILMRDAEHPSIMLLAGQPADFSLEEVFWEKNILINPLSRDRDELLAEMIDTLVAQRQLPREWRQWVLKKALSRENFGSTSVGCETAFPHVTISDFTGVTGCFVICPEGVDFGVPGTSPVRFVFLLITPLENYQDYLGILSRLARRMIYPAVRHSLLECRTAAEVQLILCASE